MKLWFGDDGNIPKKPFELPKWIADYQTDTDKMKIAVVGWLIVEQEMPIWSTPKFLLWQVAGQVGKLVGFSYLAPEHQGAHRFDPMFLGFEHDEVKKILDLYYVGESDDDYLTHQWHQNQADKLMRIMGLPVVSLPQLPGIK